MLDSLQAFITGELAADLLRAVTLLVLGLVFATLASRLVRRVGTKHMSVHHMLLVRRLVFYLILALFVASALRELGFSLAVLMGAAGVLTVAIGFAAQTSASPWRRTREESFSRRGRRKRRCG
jgi:small-conductance mechanosensitive channel